MSAADAAGAQVARLLALVPYLSAHQGAVRLQDAADLLGVSEQRLTDDLWVLFMCGLPGGYPDDLIDVDVEALEGEGVIRVSNADYLDRPLRLSSTEASALLVALQALREEAGPEDIALVDRVTAKLEAAAAEVAPSARQIDPGAGEEDAPERELRHRLERAVAARHQVRLQYYVPARDEETDRVVDPHAVVTIEGLGYLDAWCHLARAPRLFRLDRVTGAEESQDPVTTDAAGNRAWEGTFAPEEDAPLVTLALGPEARWVPEYYPVEEVRVQADRSVEVDLRVRDERWLRRLLLRLAPHAGVVRPRELGEALTAQAARALTLYGDEE